MPKDVLRPNRIGPPNILVVILAIPAAEFRGEMVNVVEFAAHRGVPLRPAATRPQAFELTKLPDIASRVLGVVMVVPVHDENVVTASAKLPDQIRPHGSEAASYKYVFDWHVISVVMVVEFGFWL